MANRIRLAPFTLLAATLTIGCGPKLEDACQNYMKVRKSDDWPVSPEIEKACVKDLNTLKGKLDKTEFGLTVECVVKAKSAEDASGCPTQFIGGKKNEEDLVKQWAAGLAVDESGSWADDKGALEESHCNEGAFVITSRKSVFEAETKNKGKWEPNTSLSRAGETELLKNCTTNRKDKAVADQFRCMRKAESAKDLEKCTRTVVDEGARNSAVGIEECVSKCRGEHPGGASAPGYMPCFKACKLSKGIP